jgi:2-polyprenyl-6-methoxyphenol hydroxylase-like FAD-dependent oxidoreductase
VSDCDVLIVGAGPVGLAAANTLLFHGVTPRLVERLPEAVNQSRAAGIQSRTLEVLQRLGLLDKFLAIGTRVHGARIFDGDKKLLGHMELETADTPFPFMLGLGQTGTERLLTGGLADHGLGIERNVELVSLKQEPDHVIAQLRHSDGREETVRGKYLIGCDGSRSAVRHQLGLELVGETIPSHWLTADCCVEWEFGRAEAVAFLTKEGFLFAMAIEEGRWRLIIPALHPLPEGQSATLEDVQAVCNMIVPVPCKLHSPHWVAQFGLNTRLVPTMKVGRVFLCGDAAHVHSPVGGQGMNTGIQDAFNLGWKLAMRLRGQAGDALLESFNVERHANAKRMLSGVGPGTKVINLRNPLGVEARNRIVNFALQFDAVRERIRRGVQEVDVNYRRGPLTGEWTGPLPAASAQASNDLSHTTDFGEGPRPGDRAPDIEALQFPQGLLQSLFESWIRNPKSQALIFSGNATADRLDVLRSYAEELKTTFGEWMDAIVIQSLDAASPGTVFDADGRGRQSYGARHECLYWVRPDGYIGFRSQPANPDALRDFLNRITA